MQQSALPGEVTVTPPWPRQAAEWLSLCLILRAAMRCSIQASTSSFSLVRFRRPGKSRADVGASERQSGETRTCFTRTAESVGETVPGESAESNGPGKSRHRPLADSVHSGCRIPWDEEASDSLLELCIEFDSDDRHREEVQSTFDQFLDDIVTARSRSIPAAPRGEPF
jgi:hypothetical protein